MSEPTRWTGYFLSDDKQRMPFQHFFYIDYNIERVRICYSFYTDSVSLYYFKILSRSIGLNFVNKQDEIIWNLCIGGSFNCL